MPGLSLPPASTTPVPFGYSFTFLLETVTMLLSLVSKFPPSCGVVSSTIFEIPKAIVSILGLVLSLAVANTIASPLSVAEKVNESPEPDAYLNWTVYAPDVELLKK